MIRTEIDVSRAIQGIRSLENAFNHALEETSRQFAEDIGTDAMKFLEAKVKNRNASLKVGVSKKGTDIRKKAPSNWGQSDNPIKESQRIEVVRLGNGIQTTLRYISDHAFVVERGGVNVSELTAKTFWPVGRSQSRPKSDIRFVRKIPIQQGYHYMENTLGRHRTSLKPQNRTRYVNAVKKILATIGK